MRRFGFFTVALLLSASTTHAEDAADKPFLVVQSGGHTAPVTRILFTPDGKEIISVSMDKTVRLWDAATGQSLAVFRPPIGAGGEGGDLDAAACSPDGTTLAVAGVGLKEGGETVFRVFLIDLAGGSVKVALRGHRGDVASLAFSHDGKSVAAGCVDNAAYLWDAASGRLLHTLEGHSERIDDLAFSPDDRLLATASRDRTARLWSVETGREAVGPLAHDGPLRCVAWKDNDTLATGGGGLTFIHLWDRSGKQLRHFDKLRSRRCTVNGLALVPNTDNEELFYTWFEGEGRGVQICLCGGAVLNLVKPEASRDGLSAEHIFRVGTHGAVSPDGTLAATAPDDDDALTLWRLRDGKPVRRLTGRGQTHYRVGWSPQGEVVGWTDALKPPADGPDLLQRSFALDQLTFGKKPDAGYLRAAPVTEGFHLERNGANYHVLRGKKVVATIKDVPAAQHWTWLPGDRIALAFDGGIHLFKSRTGERIRDLGGKSGGILDLALSPDGRYLLGTYSDQTLRIWALEDNSPDKEEPLLSLFVAGADWVAWTQEGYYAASPAGEQLMGWQVNNGPDLLASFYPAAQFHKTFYRPDVIRRVLAEGSIEKALAAADKESGQTTTAAVDVAQALPPEVAILSPAAGQVDAAEVEVKARAASKDHPITTMHLLVDGRPTAGAAARTFLNAKAGEKQEATWKVTLPDGEHHLVALAETDASLGASAEVVVTRQAAAQEPLSTLYVLAVGINAYPGSLKLNWAVEDASKIAEAFQAEAAPKPYGKVETKLLLDKDATKEGILAGLDWLKTKMTADDTAVVFYAGHGHRDRKTSQFYMLPQDVDVTNLPGTGVTGTQLKEKFKAMAGRVLVLLDACHSGSIGDSPADPGSLTDDVQRQLAAPDCGVVILCAAMAQEEAGEAAAVQHGFFTAALLSGLGGGAPRSRDGLIHLTALNFYVEEQVAELSKDEQHVVVDRPATVTSFPLVKPPAKAEEK